MESPFDLFRKNQKFWLGTLAIMAMLAFVVLPPLMQLMQERQLDNQQSDSLTVGTWNKGTLTTPQLYGYVSDDVLLNRFLYLIKLRAQAKAEALASGASEAQIPLFEQIFGQNPNFRRYSLQEFNQLAGPLALSELDSLLVMLYDRLATDMGIEVSDDTVNQFLDNFREATAQTNALQAPDKPPTVGVVTAAEFDEIRGLLQQQRPYFSNDYIFSLVRRLLARHMAYVATQKQLFYFTPLDRWNFFMRLNQRVSLAAIPIPVGNFLDQVKTPAGDVLQKYFEEHKNRLPNPLTGEPGFKVPQLATFQYFRVDFAALEAAQKPLITDAEIEKYYNEHKDLFVKRELPALPGLNLPPSGNPVPGENAPPAEASGNSSLLPGLESTPPAAEAEKTAEPMPPADSAKATEPPASESKTAEPPAENKPAEDNSSKNNSTAEKSDTPPANPTEPKTTEDPQPAADDAAPPAKSTPDSPAKPDSPATPPTDKQSRLRGAEGKVRVLTAAFLQEQSPPNPDAVPTAPKAQGTDAPPADTPPNAATPTDPATTSTTPAATTPAADNPPVTTSPQTTSADSNSTDTPAKNPPATTDAAVPPADGSSTGATDTTTQSPTNPATSNTTPSTTTPPNPATSPAPPKPVEYQPLAEVRDEIRQRLAREKAFTEKERILNALTEKMLDHANLRKVKELDHTDPTKPFVFTPFAVEVVGQEMAIEGRTVTLVSAVDFGRSELAQSLVNAGDNRQFPLSQLAFNQKMLTPYSPTRSQSATVDFLFWKTDVQPERVPDWSESAIQQQVTTAWKMIEAKKLATQQAETWAAKARAENRSIIDLHGLDTQIPAAITVSDFAWLQQTNLTSFDEPPLYEITKVPGIDQAGETFMQTVFSLPVNGIGVTSNQPGTQVYIVQVTKARDLEKLREQYLTESRSEQTFSPYNRVGAFERVESERQLFENLKKQYGVQLTRPLGTEMLEEWKLE